MVSISILVDKSLIFVFSWKKLYVLYRKLLLARDVRILIFEGSQKSIGFRIMSSSLRVVARFVLLPQQIPGLKSNCGMDCWEIRGVRYSAAIQEIAWIQARAKLHNSGILFLFLVTKSTSSGDR